MTTRRANSIHIARMRNAIQQALEFTANMDYDGFAADDRTVLATERVLEIAGEAAKQVPAEVRSLDPEVPWRRISDLGDFILDHYDAVDPRDVWSTVQGDLKGLLPRLDRLQSVLEQRDEQEMERG